MARKDKTRVKIVNKNGQYEVTKGLISTKNAFDGATDLIVKKEDVSSRWSMNRVEVNSKLLNGSFLRKAILYNKNNGKFFECTLYPRRCMGENDIATTSYLLNKLGATVGDTLTIIFEKEFSFVKPKIHTTDDMNYSCIYIAKEDANGIETFINKKIQLYKIYNTFTGATLTVYYDQIKIDKTLKAGEIRLSRRQRNYLNLELPYSFENMQFEKLKRLAKDDETLQRLLTQCYDNNGDIIFDNLEVEGLKLKRYLIDKNIFSLKILPNSETFLNKNRFSLIEKITSFFVGKSSTLLTCVRPYAEDEENLVVRLSKDNMEILGVQNMDKVKLTFGTNTFVCRVMAFEEKKYQRLNETNKKINVNSVIGVPAFIRKKLKIFDLQQTVKISRNTNSMFIKYINKTIPSTLISIYGASTLLYNEKWWGVVVCILAIPILIFLSYGEQRNNRASRQ